MERVKRRKLQLEEKKQEIKVKLIRDEIIPRARLASNRKDSPLIIPENGVVIDTTDISINEVVEMIKKIYSERLNES